MGKAVKKQSEQPKISMQDILKNYIQDDKGNIFHIVQYEKDPKFCFLRTGNTYVKVNITNIRQSIVNGDYKEINEHQWKDWVKKDNAYIEAMSQRIIKRGILCGLIYDLDEDLKKDNEGQNTLINHLERSQKACDRVANKHLDTLFGIDQNVFQNISKAIDETTTKMSKLQMHEYLFVNNMVDDILQNTDKYLNLPVEIEKFD